MSVLSRTGVGLIVLSMGLFLSYAVLLGMRAAGAQDEETTSMMGETTDEIIGETTGGEEDLCEDDEELVGSVPGSTDQTTEQFAITGSDFRVVLRATSTRDVAGNVEVDVLDEDGFFVNGAFASVDPEFVPTDSDTTPILDGPNNFSLTIDANGASYEIAVCQSPGQGGGTTDDEDTDDDGVIDNTIPRKPLPDTGGSTALVVSGSAILLLYGALVAWRLKTRER